MMMTILLNATRLELEYQNSINIVKIDRSGLFGNPFIIGIDGDRDMVCDKYKDWLNEWIVNKKEIIISKFSNKWVIEHIWMLKDKHLMCWCSPFRCHGEVLLQLANRWDIKDVG